MQMQARIIDKRQRAEHCAEVLKALAHPLRLQIVAILCEGEQHVNGLAEMLEVKQSIVSQQLRILRMRSLVGVTRCNGFALYRIAEPNLINMVHCIEQCSANLVDHLNA